MGTLLVVWWVGAIGTSTFYWFTQGRTENFVVGRMKTFFAFFLWYLFLVYLLFVYFRSASRQADTAKAKKRILD